MKAPRAQILFEFESADSIAQFGVWMVPVAGGAVVSILALQIGGWVAVAAIFLLCILAAVGLRSRITVCPGEVRVVRKWFFVPYRTYVAESIENVFYSGDWGLEEGAIGVVVKMGGRDVHLGTSRNMRDLHEALCSIDHSRRGQ